MDKMYFAISTLQNDREKYVKQHKILENNGKRKH